MSDSIRELTGEIRAFRDERDWLQFHGPKEMAVAICAEVGELLQHFVWQTDAQSRTRAEERKQDLAEEMADLGILLFEMADNLGVDLGCAMREKLAKNQARYPANKARGSNKKYNEL